MSETVDTIQKKDTESKGIGTFTKEVREELQKVSFPSTEDVRNTTIVVIVNVIFFGLFLFLIDQAWVFILSGLEWLVGKLAGY